MPIDPVAFASVFLNNLLTLLAGILCAYLTMSAFLRPRHSLALFFGYFLLKMVTVSLFDTLAFFGVADQGVSYLGESLIVLFCLGAYIVMYYSWDSSFAKVGLLSIAADFLSGIAMVASFACCSWVSGAQLSFDYVNYLGPLSFIRPMLMIIIFWVLLQVMKPVGRAIANHDFKYEFVIIAVIVAEIVVSSASRLAIQDDMSNLLFGPLFLTLLFLPAIALFIVLEWRRARNRRTYLERSKAIMAACDQALRDQSSFLAQSRSELDGLSARIEQVEARGTRADMRRHLDALLVMCDRLRFGTYSDNPALDVVLSGYAQRFDEVGLRVDYRISPLGDVGERVALAAQALLDWALQAYIRSGGAPDCEETTGDSPTISFRAFRRANRLFLEARVSVNPRHVSHMRYSDHLPAAGIVVHEWRDNGMLGIRMLVGEAA